MNDANELYFLTLQHIASKAVAMACEMRLDKILNDQPMRITDLANQYLLHPKAMYRFLRILDAYEVVKLVDRETVQQGRLSPYLDRVRSPHILNSYAFIDNLAEALKNNQECYSATFGKKFYPHLLEDPDALAEFREWCTQSAIDWLTPIFSIYDFSKFKTIVDVGGGEGYFLASLLQKNPAQTGILFDQPEVVVNAQKIFGSHQVGARATAVGGDFFKALPEQGDVYTICRTLLNWNDADAVKIINNCHLYMKKEATLLIIDFFLPEKNHPDYKYGVLADMNLLACITSAIRTKSEWLNLVAQSNFTCRNFYVTPENSAIKPILPMFVLEAVSR